MDVQLNVFLHVAGGEAVEKYSSFDLTENKKDGTKVIEVFEKFCLPKFNESENRHTFFFAWIQEGKKFVDFLTPLKKLSNTCEFGELRDSLIRNRIVENEIKY